MESRLLEKRGTKTLLHEFKFLKVLKGIWSLQANNIANRETGLRSENN